VRKDLAAVFDLNNRWFFLLLEKDSSARRWFIRTKFLKSGQKWRATLLDLKKWRPTSAEKHMKTFFWRSYQKKVFMIFVGEYLQAKVVQKLFGQVWGNSGEILRNPKNLPAPTPMRRWWYAWTRWGRPSAVSSCWITVMCFICSSEFKS